MLTIPTQGQCCPDISVEEISVLLLGPVDTELVQSMKAYNASPLNEHTMSTTCSPFFLQLNDLYLNSEPFTYLLTTTPIFPGSLIINKGQNEVKCKGDNVTVPLSKGAKAKRRLHHNPGKQ